MNNEQLPFAMSESYWANSHFSIARYTGRIHLGKYDYVICNKDGKDIFECSMEAEKAGCSKLRVPGPASMYFNPPAQVDFSGSKSWAGNFLQKLCKKFWFFRKK